MTMVRGFTQAQFQAFLNQGIPLSKQVRVEGPEDAEILMSEHGGMHVPKGINVLGVDGIKFTLRELEKRIGFIFNQALIKHKAHRLNNAFRLVSYRIQMTGEGL